MQQQYPDNLLAGLTCVERMGYEEDPRHEWPEEVRARWLEKQAEQDGRFAVAGWLARKVEERLQERQKGKWLAAAFVWEMTGEHKVLVQLIERLLP